MIKVFLSRQRQVVLIAGIILNRLHRLLWLKQSQQTRVLAKCGANRVLKLQLLFWISGSSEKENKSRPKASTREFKSSNEISFQGKRVRWH